MNKLFVVIALFFAVIIAQSKRSLPCRSCLVSDGKLLCSLNCDRIHRLRKPIDEAFATNSDVYIHDPASCTSCVRAKTGESVCTKQCNKKQPSKIYLSDGCRKCVTDVKTNKIRCVGRPCKAPKTPKCNKTALCTRKNQVFSCRVSPACNNSTVAATKELSDNNVDEYSTMSTCQHCYFTYVHGERDITCVDEPCAADIADVADIAEGPTSSIQTAVRIRYENCTSCWKENQNGKLVIRCEKDYNNKECQIKNRSEAALTIVTPTNSATIHSMSSGCKKCTVSMTTDQNGKTEKSPSVKCIDLKKQCKPAKKIVRDVKKPSNIHIRSGKDSKCWTSEINGIISIICKRALNK